MGTHDRNTHTRFFEDGQNRDGLSDEVLSVLCLCCHVLVSFLRPPLLLASAELLVENAE